jgi:CheY-like chemotaxis protein
MKQVSMLESHSGAGPAAAFDWRATDLGDRELWPHTLRLAIDIVLGAPCPMLLVWGERRIMAFNPAYADLCGPPHPAAPGGKIPAVLPPPMAAADDAFKRAARGEHLLLPHTLMTVMRLDGPVELACDLQLTPLTDVHGEVAGVLCALARSPERAAAPACSALRVLVVEDNLDSQYLVCEMLKAFGHEADGVAHAEGALEMLAKATYDVLFTDVSLPGMSGVELARRTLARNPGMRVIFASGYGDALLRQVEFPYHSLQKPYELEQLQAALAGAARAGGPPSV